MIHIKPPEGFTPKFEVVSCFLEYDGKFLLLRRQDHKSQGDTWGVPAGKIDGAEQPAEALLREMQEETGHTSSLENISHFNTLYVRYPEYDFVYHMFSEQLISAPDIEINPEEHKEFAWVTPKEALNMNLIDGLDRCIELYYGS